jgi:hypothetical protein
MRDKEADGMLLAKVALGFASTVVMAGAYTFHQGLLMVDVDEFHSGGSHVHVWAPAAVVPMALRVAPKGKLQEAQEKLQEVMPAIRELAKDLRKYPNADLIDVIDGTDHVKIGTHNGKLEIDVHNEDQNVHIACPLSTLEELSRELEDNLPAA